MISKDLSDSHVRSLVCQNIWGSTKYEIEVSCQEKTGGKIFEEQVSLT